MHAKHAFEIAQGGLIRANLLYRFLARLKIVPYFSSQEKCNKVKFVPPIASRTPQNPASRNDLNRIDIIKFNSRLYHR